MKVIVLGAGRVGEAIARDLAAGGNFDLTVADVSQPALDRLAGVNGLTTVRADIAAPGAIGRLVGGFDLAVGAVPGPMGFATLGRIIDAGIHVVDISLFEEEPWPLNTLAIETRRAMTSSSTTSPQEASILTSPRNLCDPPTHRVTADRRR